MKRWVSQKIRAIALPSAATNSLIHQQGEQIGVVDEVFDFRCAGERTARNGHVNLGSRQLAVDAPTLSKEPYPGPLDLIGERQLRCRPKLLSLMGLDSPPNRFRRVVRWGSRSALEWGREVLRTKAFDKTISGLAFPQLLSHPQHRQNGIAGFVRMWLGLALGLRFEHTISLALITL